MADSIEKKLASLRAEIESVSTEAMGYRTCDPNRAYAVKENMLCILDSISRALSPAGGDEIKLDVLRIPRSKSLDPITVYFEDHVPGVGRVTIACYGDAWTAAWSAMGERTVRQFIADVDAGYLSGAMLQLCGGNDRHRSYTDRVAAAVIAALAASPQQEPGAVVAPWPDFAGNPIHDRDRIRHPDGTTGTVLHLPAIGQGGEAWRVVYEHGDISRLSLQIGDKGRAVVIAPSGQTLAGAGGERYRLEDERWRLMNSFGNGPYQDGCVQRRIDEIDAKLTATSAGTTGDDSEDAARLPSAQGWLDSHCSVASPDWMRGWDAAREALDAARRAREVG